MKNSFKEIKELYKNPRGRALLFFIFYFIFFMFIFLLLRTSNNKYNSYDYEMGRQYSFNTSAILNNNYKYYYDIHLDDKDEVITGEKYNDKEMFTYNNKNYYYTNGNYYVKDKEWVETSVPFKYSDFLDAKKVLSLVGLAYYESKTSYESGKNVYNFLISTNTINKEFNKIDSDYDEIPNRLIISTDENNSVNSINIYLDSYCVLNKKCNKSLKINLNFSEFGKVEKIKSPII